MIYNKFNKHINNRNANYWIMRMKLIILKNKYKKLKINIQINLIF